MVSPPSQGIDNRAMHIDEEVLPFKSASSPSDSIASSPNGTFKSTSTRPRNVLIDLHRSISNPILPKSSYNVHRNKSSWHGSVNNNDAANASRASDPSSDNISLEDKHTRYIDVTRQVLDLESFNHKAGYSLPDSRDNQTSLGRDCDNGLSETYRQVVTCKWIKSLFPVLEWLPQYSIKANLFSDVVAGLTVSVLHIPQGIAYSLLAGLGPVNGLYVSFFPALIYVLMGTSRHISIGTFAIASIMLHNIAMKSGAINPPTPADLVNATTAGPLLFNLSTVTTQNTLINPNTVPPLESIVPTTSSPVLDGLSTPSAFSFAVKSAPTTLEVLTSVGLLCGLIQICMGTLRLGTLSLILSEQLVSAFSTAVAFHVATSQLAYIFGFENLAPIRGGPGKLIMVTYSFAA